MERPRQAGRQATGHARPGDSPAASAGGSRRGLYTPEQRRRRDETVWTLVQGILAPIQFLVCLISTLLVVRYLLTGEGADAATVSIIVKTLLLYTIMITGSIWEKVVFGQWLFAQAFWWEDLVSFFVLGLHSLYLAALLFDWWSTRERMWIALVAYAVYTVNATQFLLKLRAARRQEAAEGAAIPTAAGIAA